MMVDNGFRVWFDRGIDPGSEWADTIAEKIKKCSYFISLMSKNYLNSINCTSELNYSPAACSSLSPNAFAAGGMPTLR